MRFNSLGFIFLRSLVMSSTPCCWRVSRSAWEMVASIPKELAKELIGHLRDGQTIIHISWCEANPKQVAVIIDDQVQLKAKEPAH